MKEFLIFIAIIYLGVLPILLFINWIFFRKSFIYKSGIWIIATMFLVVTEAYAVGSFGLVHLTYSIPLGIVAVFLTFRSLSLSIERPMQRINNAFTHIRKGDLSIEIDEEDLIRSDEAGRFFTSLDLFLTQLKKSASFAQSLGRGNLNEKYSALSEKDILGNSLISLRENLDGIVAEMKEVIIDAGENGQLDISISIENKEGVWYELSVSINQLLNSLVNPILELNNVVNAMAVGDLTKRCDLEANGQIKCLIDNLNVALDSLQEILKALATNALNMGETAQEMLSSGEEMNGSMREIASAISQMSSGAQRQVIRVDESSNLAESMLRSSKSLKEITDQINKAAQSNVDNSGEGVKISGFVVSTIGEIADYSNMTTQSMEKLTERSREISRVLSVITDIASQTNLLALNAAIEAAQAGDAGRGFAVVAEEIRKLAEDSRKSASSIESLILSVQKDTSDAAEVIDTMNKMVKSTVDASQKAQNAFNDINGSANQTLTLSSKVLNASLDQNEWISKMVNITEDVVVIVEQAATGTEEISSSAGELSAGMEEYMKRSQWLNEVTSKLKFGVGKFKLS